MYIYIYIHYVYIYIYMKCGASLTEHSAARALISDPARLPSLCLAT